MIKMGYMHGGGGGGVSVRS